MLVNIAQTMAMQLGLHQPEAIQDFSRTKRKLSSAEVSEVVKTWSVCYIVSQSISTTNGMALASSDWMVDRICDHGSPYILPMEMRHQLLMHRFSARVSNYMSKCLPKGTNGLLSHEILPVLGLLEQELTDLSRSISNSLTDENEIILSGIGLQLYVFYLLDLEDSLARKTGLLKAFETAKALIMKLYQLDTTSNLMKYSPASYYRVTSLAALFILRLEDSSLVGLLDAEGGKQSFNAALSLLRRTSLEDNDLPGRTSKILAQLWSMQGQSQQSGKEPHLKLRTRLAASLLHDQLWNWRESFGGQGSAPHTPPREPRNNSPDEPILATGINPPMSSEIEVDRLTFEDVFDLDMLSLLPFDFEENTLFDPSLAAEESAVFNALS
ncbi:hypothetical protein N7448_008934 [Penicillium atrosanguineum]|nr:hypothetical protein N7448_008934 [Penicillium atrosanguineum]KAJ5148388.1 hypothetical protein N7526_001740 [Penicillium atrosanguineum]